MTRLGLDMDGCVYSFDGALAKFINEHTGRPLIELVAPDNWDFFMNQWGYSFEEYMELVIQGVNAGCIFRKGEPETDSVEVINDLRADGFEVIFITSRSGFGTTRDLCRQHTWEWLCEHNIGFDGLIMADNKIGRGVDLLLEDAPHQVQRHQDANEEVILFDRPWNQHVTGVDRVYSWKDYDSYVRTKYGE